MAIAVRRRPVSRPGRRLLRYDRELGARFVAGTDEAGRGALAGPLVTAAVLFDHDRLRGAACARLGLLDDSKMRTELQRERLYHDVLACAERVAVIAVPPAAIDTRGVHVANLAALAQALEAVAPPDGAALLSDGFRLPLARAHRAVIDGDAKSAAIAAASIVAKVTRDRLMRRASERYPAYGFDAHVGYSTRRHRAALRLHGPCTLHRRSFVTVALQLELPGADEWT